MGRSSRQYYREYMRRWRADPANAERIKLLYVESNERKRARRQQHNDIHPLCAFCRQRRAWTTVLRLECSPGGFNEVRRPWCGRC